MSEYSTTGSTSAALARVTAERDKARDAFALAEELRLKAVADKRSLAEERDGYRAYIDEIKAELAEVRAVLAKSLINGIDHALAQMDNHVRSGDAWFCETCGDFGPKPGAFDNHPCGPPEPIPVRVTITRRTAGEPLEEGKAPHA